MHEELAKRLRNCTSDTVEDCAGCPYQGGYKGTYCMNGLITEAADAIEAMNYELKSLYKLLGTHPDPRGENGEAGVKCVDCQRDCQMIGLDMPACTAYEPSRGKT